MKANEKCVQEWDLNEMGGEAGEIVGNNYEIGGNTWCLPNALCSNLCS